VTSCARAASPAAHASASVPLRMATPGSAPAKKSGQRFNILHSLQRQHCYLKCLIKHLQALGLQELNALVCRQPGERCDMAALNGQ
jgi:hypothetical protein